MKRFNLRYAVGLVCASMALSLNANNPAPTPAVEVKAEVAAQPVTIESSVTSLVTLLEKTNGAFTKNGMIEYGTTIQDFSQKLVAAGATCAADTTKYAKLADVISFLGKEADRIVGAFPIVQQNHLYQLKAVFPKAEKMVLDLMAEQQDLASDKACDTLLNFITFMDESICSDATRVAPAGPRDYVKGWFYRVKNEPKEAIAPVSILAALTATAAVVVSKFGGSSEKPAAEQLKDANTSLTKYETLLANQTLVDSVPAAKTFETDFRAVRTSIKALDAQNPDPAKMKEAVAKLVTLATQYEAVKKAVEAEVARIAATAEGKLAKEKSEALKVIDIKALEASLAKVTGDKGTSEVELNALRDDLKRVNEMLAAPVLRHNDIKSLDTATLTSRHTSLKLAIEKQIAAQTSADDKSNKKDDPKADKPADNKDKDTKKDDKPADDADKDKAKENEKDKGTKKKDEKPADAEKSKEKTEEEKVLERISVAAKKLNKKLDPTGSLAELKALATKLESEVNTKAAADAAKENDKYATDAAAIATKLKEDAAAKRKTIKDANVGELAADVETLKTEIAAFNNNLRVALEKLDESKSLVREKVDQVNADETVKAFNELVAKITAAKTTTKADMKVDTTLKPTGETSGAAGEAKPADTKTGAPKGDKAETEKAKEKTDAEKAADKLKEATAAVVIKLKAIATKELSDSIDKLDKDKQLQVAALRAITNDIAADITALEKSDVTQATINSVKVATYTDRLAKLKTAVDGQLKIEADAKLAAVVKAKVAELNKIDIKAVETRIAGLPNEKDAAKKQLATDLDPIKKGVAQDIQNLQNKDVTQAVVDGITDAKIKSYATELAKVVTAVTEAEKPAAAPAKEADSKADKPADNKPAAKDGSKDGSKDGKEKQKEKEAAEPQKEKETTPQTPAKQTPANGNTAASQSNGDNAGNANSDGKQNGAAALNTAEDDVYKKALIGGKQNFKLFRESIKDAGRMKVLNAIELVLKQNDASSLETHKSAVKGINDYIASLGTFKRASIGKVVETKLAALMKDYNIK